MSRVVRLSRIDGELRFLVAPRDQGQIVEIAYAGTYDGAVLRRTTDRSDGSVSYEIGDLDWDRESDDGSPPGLNRAPYVTGWEPCSVVAS